VPEHILFLTGRLAEKNLRRVLQDMQPTEFTYEVHDLGLNVAGLMTADMIGRRLTTPVAADRILVPGRCRGSLESLSESLGVGVERGPDELKDLPQRFGHEHRRPDLSRFDVRIFAEIVDAPRLGVTQIVQRAQAYRDDNADVIDIGCLPDTPFPHLEDSVRALKEADYRVSVDSLEAGDLLRAGNAGADYLLSLREDTLWIAEEVAATPVLIPNSPEDLPSLYRCIERLDKAGRACIADSVLDPIHFGFTESLVRYRNLRREHPEVEIMMGIGNLTELTEADTAGMTALLFGVISELRIGNVLTTQVSRHCRRAVREADLTRRIMYAAREIDALPKHIDAGLLALHEKKPFPYSRAEIEEIAASIRDPSFRIQVSDDGIHVYNRDGIRTVVDPFNVFPNLDVAQDGGHAFYLGVELARAQIAWQLGKRYNQDQELRWGCAVADADEDEDKETYKQAGSTLQRRPAAEDDS
jgi:dihydropteroate synthase-like protein